jgi:hypothetical protein
MKKIRFITLVASAAVLTLSSCKKFLDVNRNPNSATTVTPELVLPQALASTAAYTVTLNTYGSWQVGYTSNAGGFGAFGAQHNYNYDQNQYTGNWTTAFNILEDYQFILNETDGDERYIYYNAAARIMKSMIYQNLVDEYNDVPYTEALKGTENTSPSYDKAEDIYKDLYVQLEKAIADINTGQGATPAPAKFKNSLGNADVLFNDNMTNWKKFANTLKLRLFLRASGTSVFAGITPVFDPAGFLTDDAIVNPGYSNASGKQNPAWQAYHSSFAPTSGNFRSVIANSFAVGFYNGTKLTDPDRAKAIYRGGTNPAHTQTGLLDGNPEAPANGSAWFSGNGSTYAFSDNPDGSSPDKSAIGILKGRNMGQPIMLAAESYFLQAEGRLKNIITSGGSVKELFDQGIVSSFRYLYKNSLNVVAANPLGLTDFAGDAAEYHLENEGTTNERLANIEAAANDAQRLEAIITQKWVALNMIQGQEAWAEFRRTGYPTINNTTPYNRFQTWVSVLGAATTPDKLPGRILYPATEYQLNSQNVPTGISTWGSFVFWDRRN